MMPIYEFKCQSCEEITEKWQKISDPYPSVCPACGTGKLEKMISTTGFTLKGEGWYVTDFKNKPSASSKPSSTEPSSKTNADKKSS